MVSRFVVASRGLGLTDLVTVSARRSWTMTSLRTPPPHARCGLRDRSELYLEMAARPCALLIQEGGCAPGYNTVTACLVEQLERIGFEVQVALQGWRSV